MLRTLAFLCLLLCAFPALAQDSPPKPAPPHDSKPEIVVDQQANVVRILIDGKEIVVIDAKGLHVKGDVDYTGMLVDTEPSKKSK